LPRTGRRKSSRPILTADQRRRQVINLLAGHLARMPHAIDVASSQPKSSPDCSQEASPHNPRESSEIALEVSADRPLSVSRG